MRSNHETWILVHRSTALGGAELALLHLLSFLREKGYSTALVTESKGALFDAFSKNTSTLIIPFSFPNKPISQIKLFLRHKRINKWLSNFSGTISWLSGDLYGLHTAIQLRRRDEKIFAWWQSEYRFYDHTCAQKWLRHGAAKATTLLASAPLAEHLNSTQLLPRRIEVMNPPVNVSRFEPSRYNRIELRTRLGWKSSENISLFVGRIGGGKNQIQFCQAAIKAGIPIGWRLVLVGPCDVEAVNQLQYLVASHSDCLSWLGSRDDIPELLAAADQVLFPSLLQESFGLAVCEAILMHRPFLSFSVGAIPTLLGSDCPFLLSEHSLDKMVFEWKAKVFTSDNERWLLDCANRLRIELSENNWRIQCEKALALN